MKTRIVKKPHIRRDEILDSARRLIYSKGYEQMTIQDILDDLQIAKGTVYHYFDSKQALLDAFIEQIRQGVEGPLLPILHDLELSAIQKLQGFFDTLDRLRLERKAEVIRLGRVWYTDDNAIVREKVNQAVLEQRAPLLNEIVRQGIREGVFTTRHPDQTGEVILSLLQGMGNTHARLMLSLEHEDDVDGITERIVAVHAAYMEAIERLLGAPPNSLYRTDTEAVKEWVLAVRGGEP